MYQTIKEFITDYRSESTKTLATLQEIKDSFNFSPTENSWTLGGLGNHLVMALPTILSQVNFTLKKLPAAEQITDLLVNYQVVVENFFAELQSSWTDAMLTESVNFYGMQVKRSEILTIILKHEIHHRGQLALLLRIAGKKVPAIYGPSADSK